MSATLALGSQDVAADLPLLRSLGVTRILNVAAAPGGAQHSLFPQEFAYKNVQLLDNLDQRIDFDSILDWLDLEQEQGRETPAAAASPWFTATPACPDLPRWPPLT